MITLQFGQCGNQLGYSLFSKISSDIACTNTGVSRNYSYQYVEETVDKWFTNVDKAGKRIAKVILVDTESKAINKVRNNDAAWNYSTKNVVCQASGGSANNWAYGYSKAREFQERTLTVVQRELERSDRCEGFLTLLSTAGGTGSGTGSYIIELLRDEYKTKVIACAVVLPFSFGEVSTQSYNTLLALSKLYDHADAVFVFENEQIHNICTCLLKKDKVNLIDMNEVISEKLLAAFQPTENSEFDMNLLVSQIAPHPYYKYATIKSTPHTALTLSSFELEYNWQSCVRQLKETLRTSKLSPRLTDVEIKMPLHNVGNAKYHTYNCCVSNILFTRGTCTEKDVLRTDEFLDKHLYADWTMSNSFLHQHQERKIFGRNKFLALFTNNSNVYHPLDAFLSKSWNLYTHAAFLHQYKKFGIEEDDFLVAFAKIENTAKLYKGLNC